MTTPSTPVLVCPAEGPDLDEQAAIDVIAEAIEQGAELVAVPVSRCPEGFFDLSSGIAGAVVQKFVNYRLRLAIVGDISSYLDRSNALRDFIAETNRGRQVWFVADQAGLAERLHREAIRQGGEE